jgi:DNA-directed RNA polymerase subunit RPC12/RpoP
MKKELLKGLSEEQIKKIEACKDSEEILNLAKAEGIELTDEQLEAVSGGGCFYTIKCIKCGSDNLSDEYKEINHKEYRKFKCNNCGHRWREEV